MGLQGITEPSVLERLGKLWFKNKGMRQTYLDALRNTAVQICHDTFEGKTEFPLHFTDHGPSHCMRVLWWAMEVALHIERGTKRKFTDSEMVLLASACYLHDIGMGVYPQNDKGMTPEELRKRVRDEHPEKVLEVLADNSSRMEQLRKLDVRGHQRLADLCISHATTRHEERFHTLVKSSSNDYRLDLLSKILLLADELDLSAQRVNMHDAAVPQLDDASRAHWLRHFYIIDAHVNFPLVTFVFEFPGPRRDYRPFVDWTIAKLQEQMQLVKRSLSPLERPLFDLRFEARDDYDMEPSSDHAYCKAETLSFVREQVAAMKKQSRQVSAVRRRRARLLMGTGDDIATMHSDAHALHRVVESVFRSFWTVADPVYTSKAYVVTDHNNGHLNELATSIANATRNRVYSDQGQAVPFWPKKAEESENTRKLYVLAGDTGVGKSSFIAALFHDRIDKALSGDLSGRCMWCRLDCIGVTTRDQVIRQLLQELILTLERNLKPDESAALRANDILPKPQYVESLTVDACLGTITVVLNVLQGRSIATDIRTGEPLVVLRRFIVLALDNLDRIPNDEDLRLIVKDMAFLTQRTLCMAIVPLRERTLNIVKRIEEFGPRRFHIKPAPISEILHRRVGEAFESPTLGNKIKAIISGGSSSYVVQLDDVHGAVRNTCDVLLRQWDNHALLPSVSGSNARIALDLIRRILGSPHLTPDIFLQLSRGKIKSPFKLLRILLLAEGKYYSENRSAFLNIFRPSSDGRAYFGRFNILNLVVNSDQWTADHATHCKLDALVREAEVRYDMGAADARQIVFSLLQSEKEIPFISLYEGSTDMPQILVRNTDELSDEHVLQASPAGEYLLNHLIYQLVYIQSVMIDTPVPDELARRIADSHSDAGKWDDRKKCILDFIAYLKEREIEERNANPLASLETQNILLMDQIMKSVRSQIDAIDRGQDEQPL